MTPAEVNKLFRKNGGMLRTSAALKLGVHPRLLYRLREEGTLEAIARGVYRLSAMMPPDNLDLAVVATKIKKGVVCLRSALAFHNLTTHIPHGVDVAVPRGSEKPRLDYPPTHIFWFSGDAYLRGIEQHAGISVYSAEKTLADCFKYRNTLGMELVLEALKHWAETRRKDVNALMRFAKICRVERVIRPYLEALR